MSGKLTESLQENVLALLAYDDNNAKIAANLVTSSLFEGNYRVIAAQCIDYIKKYDRAPGRAHIKDILSDIPNNDDKSNKTLFHIVDQMYALSSEMDSRYIMEKLSTFVRLQTLKLTTMEVAEKLQSGQEHSIAEVEAMWHRILKADTVGFVPGMRGTEVDRVLDYIRVQQGEFLTGIPVLDQRGIVPSRGHVDLFVASTGMGKSWWLVNIGKQALIHRKRVLYISLEMAEEEVAARFMQTFCSIGTFEKVSAVAEFDRDDDDKVVGVSMVPVEAEFTLNSAWARDELGTYINATGARFQNLMIKAFPTGTLTIQQLEAYLDTLERAEGFVPDMLLLDYVGLLHVSDRDYRIGLGRVFKQFRGLIKERNLVGSTAQQATRVAATSSEINITDVSEDWSLSGTADQVFTYTATSMELQYKLGRIFVAKARNRRDKFSIVVAQNYGLGQFCVDSFVHKDDYWDMLKELNNDDSTIDDEEDDDYDD